MKTITEQLKCETIFNPLQQFRLIHLVTFLLAQTYNHVAIPTTTNPPKIAIKKCFRISKQPTSVLKRCYIYLVYHLTCVLEVLEHSNLRP